MGLDPQSIRDRLQRLSKKDSKRKVFGAASHDYVLNPPLDAAQIESFEAKHGITLPEDYKLFITEIGDGGAGPAYGLFPFGQQDDNFGLRSWEGGDLLGDCGQPFPHTEAWNLDNDFWEKEPDPPEGISKAEEDKLWEEWDKVLAAEYWNPAVVNGAFPICHLGCGQRQWLVVQGDQRGFVWDDMRADNAGLAPVKDASGQQMTFAEWYLAWLDEAERGGKKPAIETVPHRERVPRSRRETLTLLLLIVAGVLLGLAIAVFRSRCDIVVVMTTAKRKAIRTTLARLGMHATSQQVVEALHDLGIEVSERFVSQVKAQMMRDEAKAIRQRSKRPPKTKSRSRPQQQKIPPRRG